MKRRGIWIIVVIVLALVYFFFNPNNMLFPKCPFHLLTGYSCPGCGSQRAIYSLLHGDIIAAFCYNALLVVSLPIIGLLLYAEFRRTKKPVLYLKLNNVIFIRVYLAIVIFWWIGRNIFAV